MKVIERPSTERFNASSDFEVKLVTILSVGTGRVPSCPAIGRDVVEEDGGRDAEAAVGVCVVPDIVGIEQVRVFAVIARDAAGNGHGSSATGGGRNIDGEPGRPALASEGQRLADGDGRGLSFVDTATDDQRAGHEVEAPIRILGMVLLRV